MPDPIDQNIPPAAPPPTLPDPQAMVDAALSTPTTTAATPSTPVLPPVPPTPEPVAPPTLPPAPAPMPTPAAPTVAMGDDTPLAFVTPPPSAGEVKAEPAANLGTSVPMDAVPPAPTPAPEQPVKKKKGLKILGMFVGFFALIGVVGLVSYRYLGFSEATINYIEWEPKWIRVDGEVQLNPDYKNNTVEQLEQRDEDLGIEYVEEKTSKGDDPASCNGCLNGGWMVWRDGECKITGACNSGVPGKDTENPMIEESNTADDCFRSGGTWCANIVDTSGVSHAFCGASDGRACYQLAVDEGITVSIGTVGCECDSKVNNVCTTWSADASTEAAIAGAQTSDDTQDLELIRVDKQCQDQGGSFTTAGNKEMWICPVGTMVACTSGVTGAKRFYGDIKNGFCGVVQIDTGTGHTSYSSTSGCNEDDTTTTSDNPTHKICNTTTYQCETVSGAGADTCTTDAQCAPNAPVMACTGLTQVPVAPVVGDKVTFTCTGTITPSTAGTLSYKFHYSINNAAPTAMVNKTATTTELNIAACGEYKVECQTCATISGVFTCDPNWIGATQ